jgi:uncharacterized membrane protein
MKRVVFWLGILVLIAGLFLFFLAGATTGPEMEPLIPSIYQTNQTYWLVLTFAGLILVIAGLLMKFKSNKSKAVQKNKK